MTGATAVLARAGEPRREVEVPEGMSGTSPLVRALTASGYAALAGEPSAPPIARVVAEDDMLLVVSREGQRVGKWPATGDMVALGEVVHGLVRQAALLGLHGEDHREMEKKCRIAPVSAAGGLEIRNVSQRPFYVSAFALRTTGGIELITRTQPDGECVASERSLMVRIPADRGSVERVVVVATEIRVDLRGWTVSSPEPPEVRRGDSEPCFGVHVLDVPRAESSAAER